MIKRRLPYTPSPCLSCPKRMCRIPCNMWEHWDEQMHPEKEHVDHTNTDRTGTTGIGMGGG